MKKFLSQNAPNFILWMPFVFALGAAFYFALPSEPIIKYPFIISAIIAILAFVFIRKRQDMDIRIFVAVIIPLIFGFGFFYTYAFSHAITLPTIKYDMREKQITGIVQKIDFTDTKARIFIKNATTENNDSEKLNIRISIDMTEPIPPIGSRVSAKVTIFKPSAADVPGGFDFAEWAYFKNLSGTGFFHNAPVIIDLNANMGNINLIMHDLRHKIHTKVSKSNNPTATGLSDSLVLGFTNAISSDASKYAKAAGIAHVFSISGFHITLVGGWLFAIFYLLFRLVYPVTRNIPARIPAMILSWVGLLFYMGLSGAAVAMQRAFLMATLGFIAFFFHRTVFSLRNVCLVFGLLLLLNPHYVIEAGFQLSFAAIFGLVYFLGKNNYKKRSFLQKTLRVIGIILLTDFIATIFTAPFVAYHFGYIPIYSLVGNLLCLPIFTFLIMPLVLTGTITAIFETYFPLDGAAYFYDITIEITKFIYHLPWSQIQIPPVPGFALALLLLGFLSGIFLITSRRIKIHIISGISLVFVLIVAFYPRPIFYATHDHELVAFMTDIGKLQFNKKTASKHKFTFNSWSRVNADSPTQSEDRRAIGKGFDGKDYSVECKDKVCIYKTPNFKLAYIQQFVPLFKNIEQLCVENSGIDFIISYFKIDAPYCHANILYGGLVIYKSGRVKYTPANRIWHQ